MEENSNYQHYTLDQLKALQARLDEEKHPEIAEELAKLIAFREEHGDSVPLPIPNSTSGKAELATRGERLAAAIIDGVISILAYIPLFSFYGLERFDNADLELIVASFVYGVITTIVIHGYFIHYYGQTLGKHFLNIRIETMDGEKADFSTILYKRMIPIALIANVPFVGTVFAGLIDPLSIFREDRRCFHDLIAGTQVTRWTAQSE